jgi:hypothetical protein
MLKNAYLGLFVICVLLSPVSLFAPGMPQPTDFVLALLIVVLLTTFVIPVPLKMDLFLVGGSFVVYVFTVNLFWYGNFRESHFLFQSIYYVFNLGALLVVVSLVRSLGGRFISACRIAIMIAIAFEIAWLIVMSTGAYRSAGTFSNPNALGYWGLLLSCCLLVLSQNQRLNLTDFLALSGAGYLTMVSLSKAAMLSFVVVLVMAMFFQRVTRPLKVMLVALIFVGSVAAITDSETIARVFSVSVFENVADRLGGIGAQGDDSLGGRGYDRLWRHPEHLILGAGEGAYWRFSPSPINPRQDQFEMHSTFGTVLFAYGIVGLTLFLSLLAVIFWHAPVAHVLYSLPVWAYGITHQGLRDTMLWVFLGLVFGLAHYGRSADKRSAATPVRGDRGVLVGSPDAVPTSFSARPPQRSPRL